MTVLTCLCLYLLVMAFAYLVSDRMIFPVRRRTYEDGPEILKLKTADGARISAIYLPNPAARFTLLFSHGNAEDLGDASDYLEELRDHGYSVFAYDYHGYGTSEGSPSEKNAYLDVQAAYDYLVRELKTPPDRIIALGRSVGAGAAIDLASKNPLAGLIVESAFATAFRVVTHVALFPFDKFRNIDKIGKVRCPVLVMHGENDEIVAFWHGRKLFEKANEPKSRLWVPGAGHNDLMIAAGQRYWEAIEQFTKTLGQSAERTSSASAPSDAVVEPENVSY